MSKYCCNILSSIRFVLLSFVLLFFSTISVSIIADTFTDRRITVGLKLFRTMIIADTGYKQKVVDEKNIKVSFIYSKDERFANELESELSSDIRDLHGVPVVFDVVSVSEYLASDEYMLGGFISEKLSKTDLKNIIDKSIRHQQILFSPFEGDVEYGVLGGVSVESKVRPFVNVETLKKGKIRIKSFYLRVAKKYEN